MRKCRGRNKPSKLIGICSIMHVMPKNIVVLLKSEEGRALVKAKCVKHSIRMHVLEDLISLQLGQLGKRRHAVMPQDLDQIFDEASSEEQV